MPVDVKASYLRVYRIGDGRKYGSVSGSSPDPIDSDLIEVVEGLEHAIAPGETVYFDGMLAVAGEPDHNLAVVVLTPPNPNGGFTVFGRSKLGTFTGKSYRADDFNQPVGILQAGVSGTLEGWNTIRVRGTLANSDQPGLLRLAVGSAANEQGTLWVTTNDSKLWRFSGTSWEQINAAAFFNSFVVRGVNLVGTNGVAVGAEYSLNSGELFSASDYTDNSYDVDIAVDDSVWLIGEDPIDFAFAIFKSVDKGASYIISYTPSDPGESPLNVLFGPNIVCHPTDVNKIAALQIDELGNLDLVKTTDGGANWSHLQLVATISDADWSLSWLADGRLAVFGFNSIAGDRNIYRLLVSSDLLTVEETNTDLEGGAANITGWTWSQARGDNAFVAITTEHNVVGGDPQEHLYRHNGAAASEIALPINHASPAEGTVVWAVYDSVGDILYLAGKHTGEANVRLWKLPSPMTAALADFVEMDVPSSGNITTMAIG